MNYFLEAAFESSRVQLGARPKPAHISDDIQEEAEQAVLKMAARNATRALLSPTQASPDLGAAGGELTLTYIRETVAPVKFIRWPRLHQCWVQLGSDSNVLIRQEAQRTAGFVELFYDLVYVVILAAIGTTWNTNGPTLLFFVQVVAVIRLWKDSTVYLNLFDAEDLLHKIMLYFLMLGVLGLAIGRDNSSSPISRLFAGSFLWVRFILILLHLWCAMIKKARVYSMCISVQFFLSSMFWLASFFTHESLTREGLWMAGLLFDYVGDVLRTLPVTRPLPTNVEHIEERFGLFVIILIGENVTAAFFPETGTFNVRQYGVAAMSVLLAFCFQQLYHDVESGFYDRGKKKHSHNSVVFGLIWDFVHVPLSVSFVVLAGTLHSFVAFYGSHDTHKVLEAVVNTTSNTTLVMAEQLHEREVWGFVAALAGSLLFCSIIGWSHSVFNDSAYVPSPLRLFLRVGACLFLVLMGLVDYWTKEPLALLGVGSLLTLAIVALEMESRVAKMRWYQQRSGRASRRKLRGSSRDSSSI